MIDTNSAVIARLDRAIQYAAASRLFSDVSGILDPSPCFRGDDENVEWPAGGQDV
jgi:hypothetical protein